MRSRAVVWLCVAAILGPAWAQTVRPTVGTGSYEGRITGTDVYIRSGSSTSAYFVAKISKPATVTVIGRDERSEWLQIRPVAGCYSAVSKNFVRLDAGGKTGTVTGDNVWVRAAGDLRKTGFWALQTRLNTADKIQVLGEAEDYYLISPPPGAAYWVSAQYVKRPGEADTAERPPAGGGTVTVAVPPSTTAGAGEQPGTTTVAPKAATEIVPTVATTQSTEQVSATLAEFNAAEKDLIAEYKKPVAQRDYEGLIAKYTAIKAAGDNKYLQRYIDARVAMMKAGIEQRTETETVSRLVKKVAEEEKTFRMERALVKTAAPTTRPVTAYAAQGVLLPSDIFPGGPSAPKRYIVRDPQTFFINAYVQCTSGSLDLNDYVAKLVGILGDTRYDKDLGLDVVEARQMVVLNDNVVFPAPPKPIVKPLPPPPPAPTTKPAIMMPVPIVPVTPEPKAGLVIPPVIPVEPKVEPKAVPKIEPVVPPVVPPVIPVEPKVEPKAVPKIEPVVPPVVPPVIPVEPKIEPKAVPEIEIKVEPIKPGPTTRPVLNISPTTKASPTTRPVIPMIPIIPTTMPAATKPVPPTGLPLVVPTTQTAPIVEKEYD